MAEAAAWDFDSWLRDTLVGLSTDDEVFSPYIKGILEGDENSEEKLEALQGILAEITDNGIEDLCKDIIQKWTLSETKSSQEDKDANKVDVNEKLARIMEEQAQCVVAARPHPTDHHNLKNAILAQYAEVSDGEESESGEEGSGGGAAVMKNTNADEVVRAEKEKREKDKEESQRKREKDKEDRAKQKLRDDERKEKEKKRTQKGERRR